MRLAATTLLALIPTLDSISPFLPFPACEMEDNLALDAGVVLEFYPSPRTIFRVDLGDTIVFHDEQPVITVEAFSLGTNVVFLPPPVPPPTIHFAAETTHSFQMSFGLSFRF